MKAYEVFETKIKEGIPVIKSPYPHIALGNGKTGSRIAIRKSDADILIRPRLLACPDQRETIFTSDPRCAKENYICKECGQKYEAWEKVNSGWRCKHPNKGKIEGPLCIHEVEIMAVKNKERAEFTGYLIVAPRSSTDKRALVLWKVPGFSGSITIFWNKEVILIANGSRLSSRKDLTIEITEVLAILKPGQKLIARRQWHQPQKSYGQLFWDGKELSVIFGGKEIFIIDDKEIEGEYL